MPRIRITDETMRTIRGEATYEFHQTGIRQADGTGLVECDDEVAARLDEIALPGERVDDTIQRVIRQHRGDRPTDGGSARLPPPDQGRRFSFGGRTTHPLHEASTSSAIRLDLELPLTARALPAQ